MFDGIRLVILGDRIESLSVTCHEIEQAATELPTVVNCRAAVQKSLAHVKGALGLTHPYAIARARLVYVGPLDRRSEDARRDRIENRPMWQVLLDKSPGKLGFQNTEYVYLDAFSGVFTGHRVR